MPFTIINYNTPDCTGLVNESSQEDGNDRFYLSCLNEAKERRLHRVDACERDSSEPRDLPGVSQIDNLAMFVDIYIEKTTSSPEGHGHLGPLCSHGLL